MSKLNFRLFYDKCLTSGYVLKGVIDIPGVYDGYLHLSFSFLFFSVCVAWRVK